MVRIGTVIVSCEHAHNKSLYISTEYYMYNSYDFMNIWLKLLATPSPLTNCYSDLDSLLGKKWFIRGINESGDFCYVMLETVRFYMSEKSPHIDYQPDGSKFKKMLY